MSSTTTTTEGFGTRQWRRGQRDDWQGTLRFDQRGLLPAIAQDRVSGAVLMLAWVNERAVRRSTETGVAHFYSRSRESLWRKGETSGNELLLHEIWSDCDRDTLLYRVDPVGPACHTGQRSCFDGPDAQVPVGLELGWLADIVSARAKGPASSGSYTRRLLDEGIERCAQKVGEEAVETVIAALGDDQRPDGLVSEAADLVFHLLVLLQARGVGVDALAEELRSRHRERAPRSVEGER